MQENTLRGIKAYLLLWRNIEQGQKPVSGKLDVELWGMFKCKKKIVHVEQDIILDPNNKEFWNHVAFTIAQSLSKAWKEIEVIY